MKILSNATVDTCENSNVHKYQQIILNKFLATKDCAKYVIQLVNLLKERLQHSYFPAKLAKLLRTPIL